METADLLSPEEALVSWQSLGAAGRVEPCHDGLINRTYFIGDPPRYVLQWVNPIFDARIQQDFVAVAGALTAAGLVSPRLLATDEGALEHRDQRGFWRLMTYIPGQTRHRLASTQMANSVGRLVGRFHRVLEEAGLVTKAPPRRIHQTEKRLGELSVALGEADGHELADPARRLGEEILDAWSSWQGALDLPERLCHGDLKVSNIRLDSSGEHALCLLDLDTLGPQDISAEMGDAWRSWCNPAAEDEPQAARLDLDLFIASARGWLAEAPALSGEEKESLVAGIERISLELAARFCADAVRNDYFREDRKRFPVAGEHNLARARSQFILAQSARRQRSRCEQALWGTA